ncbi:MAG: GIY-YIG nuclease family protein [Candidatus Dojkabacteria bacterium]|nr:GIY-YIG nuclease family protein [Candidatus Dojkabacteria bacterium]
MSYYVYILRSQETRRFYIGCTKNIGKRLRCHNRGENKSTRCGVPWEVVCYREFKDAGKAYVYEKKMKSYKGGNAFKKIINGEVAEWLKATVC